MNWAAGPAITDFESRLAGYLGVRYAVAVNSGTSALHAVLAAGGIGPGDEVIVPSFTFVSTVNAFVLRGARPIFVDIHPDTLNMDETQLEQHISPRTRAIVPVHYAGVGCEMDTICETAARHGIPVIEDNAHGLFGKYKGRFLGTFGAMATQSFHETKNFTCGEGGALLINDRRYAEQAEIIREKGTNRSRFFRGQVDKYTWVDVGSSYLPSDILAAFLWAQLEQWEHVQSARKKVWEYYSACLDGWAEENEIRLPTVPTYCEQSFHMFYLILPSLEKRSALISHLKGQGILSVFHYLPLHLSQMGQQWGYKAGDCPVTEDTSDRLLRLPFYNDLQEPELERVCEELKAATRTWQKVAKGISLEER